MMLVYFGKYVKADLMDSRFISGYIQEKNTPKEISFEPVLKTDYSSMCS